MLSRFRPDVARGTAVDVAVRLNLGRSLRSLYERVAPLVSYDPQQLKTLLDTLGHGPVRPAVFGTYTDLVEAVLSGDAEAAQKASDQLLELLAPCPATRIVTLTSADLGPGQPERYARLVDDDPEQRIFIEPVSDKTVATSAIAGALSLIEASAPSLASEIQAIVHEVVMVEPGRSLETGELARFDGASTLYLWGAVITRIGNKSRVDLAQTLAHESGHLLLFGLTRGKPLVDNAYDELYESPLRADARPMEGLVHAAYVIARMHYTLDCLLQGGKLTTEEEDCARQQLAQHELSFRTTLPTIERGARFSSDGAAIFDGAKAYMSAVIPSPFGVETRS